MTSNKQFSDIGETGHDWRSDSEASLASSDPEKAKRRPGRPKGSMNRKTQDFASWYDAQGFKDPLQLQAEFMSADPVALQAWFIEHERTQKAIGKAFTAAVPSLAEIVKEQMARADAIAPYLHGKAPAREDQDDERLPFLIINADTNQLAQGVIVAQQKGLSVGRMLDVTPNKINDLAQRQAESSKPYSSMDQDSK